MYIKSLIIDGFKSYGKRVYIDKFDIEFNAITGLNGTGKSNILDAICFVLGITNLSKVRVGNLQDFIYKSGQDGITKASVSIIFDNTNEEQCPPGFEGFDEINISRQVVMGGKSKYWINGSIVPNKKVQDMFCSIQLNVNNPHFLIMQGRVTKVLNMKPHEILAMVEEAAGTRMYETKRQVAQATIDKKQTKLTELNTLFEEEIFPRLDKLRQERQAYLEFLRIERQLEHMQALQLAFVFYATQRDTKKAEQKLDEFKQKISAVNDGISENTEAIKEIEDRVAEATKEAEEKTGGCMQDLEASIKLQEKEEAKASAAELSTKQNIAAEEKVVNQLEKNCKDDTTVLSAKKEEQAAVHGLFETLKLNDETDNAAFAISQKKYEAICAGMEVNDEGETETLQEQLMHAKQEAAQSSTEMKTASMELMYCKSQLNEKEKELGSNAADYQKDAANLKIMESEVNRLKADLTRLNFSETRMNECNERNRALTGRLRSLRDKVEDFERHRPETRFSYSDPYPGFDRSTISGVVCKLITLKDPNAGIALEIVAGRKLSNIVGATKDICKDVLNKGRLSERKTFIPLDKIQRSWINENVVKLAQDLCGRDNVKPAISLIDYDEKYKAAMEHCFGGVFVCKDLTVARKVAFHPKIMKRCVTLDGEVADPSGTLTGGSKPKGTPLLVEIAEIVVVDAEMREKERELAKLQKEMGNMGRGQDQYERIKHQLDLKEVELAMLNRRIQQTTHHQQQQEINTLKEQITTLTRRLAECKEIEANSSRKAKDLEHKMKDAKGHRERQLKEAETEMKRNKAKAEKSRKEWQKREQDYETLNLEVTELEKGLENTAAQITDKKQRIVELKEQYATLQVKCQELKAQLVDAHKELKGHKAEITAKNKDIQKQMHRKEKLIEKNTEFELEVKKLEQEIQKFKDEYNYAKAKEAEAAKKVNHKDDRNMKDAKELSDKEGNELSAKIAKFRDKRNHLSRTVNTKAQSMFEHEEKQFNALNTKKNTVEADRNRIKAVIDDLDKKKIETLELAFAQITKDFGSIFNTLLPGSNAKLKVPDGKTILNGLEVKVSFGGVWKESLTELSGGQRSLVALSLILAMLLFKPAPLYILDEVDAALDLSHTQNIGNMLRTHFKQSQFIIVSLKDGMFNNANVLFRTKFVDGMSFVSRTQNTS